MASILRSPTIPASLLIGCRAALGPPGFSATCEMEMGEGGKYNLGAGVVATE